MIDINGKIEWIDNLLLEATKLKNNDAEIDFTTLRIELMIKKVWALDSTYLEEFQAISFRPNPLTVADITSPSSVFYTGKDKLLNLLRIMKEELLLDVYFNNSQLIDNLRKEQIGANYSMNQIKTVKDVQKPEFPHKVFIVHGHDEALKETVARFLGQLGLEPIILHEKPNSGKTIIEKIEAYTDVGFGVVLYTPCDVGSKKGNEVNLKNRARQNVVFEHGYLIGKIGRNNVAALVKGEIETPNDISGVVYISLESEWRISLAKELRNSGYNVDMNLIV